MTITVYLCFAAWFWLVDLTAGRVHGSPCRPVAAALLALIWPVSVAFAVVAAAALLRAEKEKSGVSP